jgi:phosphatidylglycerophosphate synthase
MASPDPAARRPLKSRDVAIFRKLAAGLAQAGVSPNAISGASIVFGGAAGGALAATLHAEGWALRAWWLVAALCIQGRLLANMLDGMVAVEGGKGGPTGDLWNEAPDRISDAATLIGAGYAAGSHPLLGFGAALMAVFVAYMRALGASVGAGQIFLGPQAKPHRMAVLTAACLITAAFPTYLVATENPPNPLIAIALLIVIFGGAITAWRRGSRIATYLRSKPRL